jgi:hypothetical protein
MAVVVKIDATYKIQEIDAFDFVEHKNENITMSNNNGLSSLVKMPKKTKKMQLFIIINLLK